MIASRPVIFSSQTLTRTALIIIFTLGSILALAGLDNAYFWDDEAYVGIHAENFLKFGQLTGWSGRNLYAYNNGTVLDGDLRPINPPLDVLLTAGSFAIFGSSTWAGRFPFALIGLSSLLLFYRVLRLQLKDAPVAQVYAFCALALSTIFLLNIRTCRYYAPAIFFALGCYLAWQYALRGTKGLEAKGLEPKGLEAKPLPFLLMALCGIGLFYSNYLLCATFGGALLVTHLVLHRRVWSREQWKYCALALGIFLLATVPYAFVFRIWHRPDIAFSEPWYVRRPILMWWTLRDLSTAAYLSWIVVFGLILYLWLRHRKTSAMSPANSSSSNSHSSNSSTPNLSTLIKEWLLLIFVHQFVLAMLTPQPVSNVENAEFRYFATLLPFCAALTGVFLWLIHRRTKIGAALVLLLLLCTNLLTLHPWYLQLRFLMPALLHEISTPYLTANQAVAQFLRSNARQDQTVHAFPQYLNYPIMFYAGDKIKLCCTLDQNTPLPMETVRKLNAPLFAEENYPHWYIAFNIGDLKEPHIERLQYFSRRHREGGRLISYPYNLHKRLDVYWDQTQRPELNLHSFGRVQRFDPMQSIFIFKRGQPVVVR